MRVDAAGKFWFLLVFVTFFVFSCTDDDDEDDAPVVNSEALILSTAATNLSSAGSSDSGLANGGPTSIGLTTAAFNVDDDCTSSGTLSSSYSTSSAGWPLYTAYCNLVKRPNGPDTIRGAVDRASGWICAVGNVTFDGQARELSLKINTDCFSEGFVTMAVEQLGTDTITSTVTGYSSITGIGPTDFSRYLTFESSIVNYTILVKDETNIKSIAVREGLPSTESSTVFSVYMNQSAGIMKVEGRYSPQDSDDTCESNDDSTNCRHIRFHMVGALDSNFGITNVEELHFLGGELSYYVSLSGTPAAGRTLRYRTTSDVYASAPTAFTDDGECYGETGAACTDNTGILVTDANYLFSGTRGTTWTTGKEWFVNNSYLGATVDLTTDPDADIWANE